MNARYQEFLNSVRNKKIAVLGMGVSNIPLIRLLLSAGAKVTACDKRSREEFNADLLEAFAEAELHLGEDYLDHLDHEMIFRTPGMRPDVPQIKAAVENGAVLTSEMEQFFAVCPCPIIGVTGSDGKTTTTTIIYELLKGLSTLISGFTATQTLMRELLYLGELL